MVDAGSHVVLVFACRGTGWRSDRDHGSIGAAYAITVPNSTPRAPVRPAPSDVRDKLLRK